MADQVRPARAIAPLAAAASGAGAMRSTSVVPVGGSGPPGSTPPGQLPGGPSLGQVIVKKYANRRLYNTESSSYITLDNLAEMVRAGRDFAVFDAKTGDDITRSVLTQIIVEEESKGTALLPTGFLRQLIGFYGDSMQGLVPKYLEQAMSTFARQQQQMRVAMQQTMGNFFPFGIEEMGRQNMAMMERAMSLFTGPFYRPSDTGGEPGKTSDDAAVNPAANTPAPTSNTVDSTEVGRLRAEIDELRRQLEAAKNEASPVKSNVLEVGAPNPETEPHTP